MSVTLLSRRVFNVEGGAERHRSLPILLYLRPDRKTFCLVLRLNLYV